MFFTKVRVLLLFALIACSDDLSVDVDDTSPSVDPTTAELGLRLAAEFVTLDLEGLSPSQVNQVALGSYLVNGAAGCIGCHGGDAGYLAGGNEFNLRFLPPDVAGRTSIFARNLTPDPETGLLLTEAEFIESMRTGKDIHDSKDGPASRMIIMPTHIYRFMLEDDLKAIYAFLRRIPPIRNPLRLEYIPPFPFPPVPIPPVSPSADPSGIDRGLEIPTFFSSGPEADVLIGHFTDHVAAGSQQDRNRIGRGSYLVNAVSDCGGCHTDGTPDGRFDSGLLQGTFDVNPQTYLAGGVNLGALFGLSFEVNSRNLTPHPSTGLELTEAQFVQAMRFGADFRRSGGSLRVQPHFPLEFRMVDEDLKSIYAYLRSIPPVENDVMITP